MVLSIVNAVFSTSTSPSKVIKAARTLIPAWVNSELSGVYLSTNAVNKLSILDPNKINVVNKEQYPISSAGL